MEYGSAVTRQELLRLKRRLVEVRSGYKLLEQKRDSLIKTFMELKGTFLDRKERLHDRLKIIISTLEKSLAVNPLGLIDSLSLNTGSQSLIETKSQSIMGVKTTTFTLKKFLPPEIDELSSPKSYFESVENFTELIPELIDISSLEDALIKIALAIEKTRRRVNVLRDIIIPEMEKQKRYISLKLADQERESFVFNLKFKQKRARNAG